MYSSIDPSKDDLNLRQIIRSLSIRKIRQPITYEQIKAWLRQFEQGPELTLALLILRYLIYRTSDQLISSLKQALKCAAISYVPDGYSCEDIDWRDILIGNAVNLKFYFGPPKTDYAKPGKSGELISRLLKSCVDIASNQLVYPSEYSHKALKINERYLLVDDGIFTGDQMDNFISDYGDFMSSGNQTGIVVGLAHDSAIDIMKRKYPNIPLFYGERISEKECFKSISQEWIDDEVWPYDKITPLQQYFEIIQTKARFSDDESLLGYGDLGCLVAYEHGIPDNSLRLLWDQSDTWKPLITRL